MMNNFYVLTLRESVYLLGWEGETSGDKDIEGWGWKREEERGKDREGGRVIDMERELLEREKGKSVMHNLRLQTKIIFLDLVDWSRTT